MNLWNRT